MGVEKICGEIIWCEFIWGEMNVGWNDTKHKRWYRY